MRRHKKIDVAALKRELHYDPDTGIFTRLIDSPSGRSRAGFQYLPKTWNQYMQIRVKGVSHAAHRLAWAYMTGQQPNVVDHDNGLRHDNRWTNLKNGTYSDNSKNKKKHRIAAGTYIPQPD